MQPKIAATVPTLVFTTHKKTGETVVKNVITPPVTDFGLGITQAEVNNLLQSGAGAIDFTTFAALYFCTKGKRIDLAGACSLPDMHNVLGVDLEHSPHCIVKVYDDNAADKVAFFIVKSDNTDIVRTHVSSGGGSSSSTETRIIATAAIAAAKARWGREGDIVSALLADFNVRKKKLASNGKPIIVDFTGSNATDEHATELQFLLQSAHGDIASRVSIVGIA